MAFAAANEAKKETIEEWMAFDKKD